MCLLLEANHIHSTLQSQHNNTDLFQSPAGDMFKKIDDTNDEIKAHLTEKNLFTNPTIPFLTVFAINILIKNKKEHPPLLLYLEKIFSSKTSKHIRI